MSFINSSFKFLFFSLSFSMNIPKNCNLTTRFARSVTSQLNILFVQNAGLETQVERPVAKLVGSKKQCRDDKICLGNDKLVVAEWYYLCPET